MDSDPQLMSKPTALRLVTTNNGGGLQPTHPSTHVLDRPTSRVADGETPSRTTIMVVEDDAVLGRILSNALALAGYGVCLAATGSEACALQPHFQPDLIILDLMLPDVDGLVLTTTLKAMTDSPIIICSARAGQVDRMLGLRLGAADFVAKPFDLDDFQTRIEAVVTVRKRQLTTS